MTDADLPTDPDMPRPTRQIRRLVVSAAAILAVIALLIFALRPGIESAHSLLPLFHGTAVVWALAAVACQAVMYLCIAGVLRAGLSAARDSPPAIPTVNLAGYGAAFLWANRALPGPAVAGLATLVFLLGRRGIGAASAQAAAATFYVADYVAFAPLSVIVIVLLSQFSHLAGLHSVAMFIALGLVGAGMVASIVILKSPRHATSVAAGAARFVATVFRRRDADALSMKASHAITQFYERWSELTARPGPLVRASLCSLCAHLADIATMFCAARAFASVSNISGGPNESMIGIYFLAASTAFVAGNLAAIVSFLPAGLGFFEGAMVTSLHLVGGLTIAQAALATILYRLLSVWLPLPFVIGTARHAVAEVSAASRQVASE